MNISFSAPDYMRSYQESRKLGNYVDVHAHCKHSDSYDFTVYTAHSHLLSSSSPYLNLIMESPSKKKLNRLELLPNNLVRRVVPQNNESILDKSFYDKNDNSLSFCLESSCKHSNKSREGFNFEENIMNEFSNFCNHKLVTLRSFLSDTNEIVLVVKGLDPIYFKYALCSIYNEDFTIEKEHLNFFLCFIERLEISSLDMIKSMVMKDTSISQSRAWYDGSFFTNAYQSRYQNSPFIVQKLSHNYYYPTDDGVPEKSFGSSLFSNWYTCSDFCYCKNILEQNISMSVKNSNFKIENLLGLNIENAIDTSSCNKVPEDTCKTEYSNAKSMLNNSLSTNSKNSSLYQNCNIIDDEKGEIKNLEQLELLTPGNCTSQMGTEPLMNVCNKKDKFDHPVTMTISGNICNKPDLINTMSLQCIEINETSDNSSLFLNLVSNDQSEKVNSAIGCKQLMQGSFPNIPSSIICKNIKIKKLSKVQKKPVYDELDNNDTKASSPKRYPLLTSVRMLSSKSSKIINKEVNSVRKIKETKLNSLNTVIENVTIKGDIVCSDKMEDGAKFIVKPLNFRTDAKLKEHNYSKLNDLKKNTKVNFKRHFDVVEEKIILNEGATASKILKLDQDVQQGKNISTCTDCTTIEEKIKLNVLTNDESVLNSNIESEGNSLGKPLLLWENKKETNANSNTNICMTIADCIICSFSSNSYSEMYDHIVLSHYKGVINHLPCYDIRCPIKPSSHDFVEHIRHHIVIFQNPCSICSFSSKSLHGIQNHIGAHKKYKSGVKCRRTIRRATRLSKLKCINGQAISLNTNQKVCFASSQLLQKYLPTSTLESCKVPAPASPKDYINVKGVFASNSFTKFCSGIVKQYRKDSERYQSCFNRAKECCISTSLFCSKKLKQNTRCVSTKNRKNILQKKDSPNTQDRIVFMEFRCLLCKKVYPSNISLAEHYYCEHRFSLPFHCPFKMCPIKLNNAPHLYTHIINHTYKSKYMCSACSYSCPSKNGICNHSKKHEEILQTVDVNPKS